MTSRWEQRHNARLAMLLDHLDRAANQWPVLDPREREPDRMTDEQADREYAEDADRAADRHEKERGY